MFWCDVGLTPRIHVANLTGGDRKVLVGSKLYWPTGLAIDLVMDRLFWCDMKEHEIETIFTNGTDRRVVLTSSQLYGEFSEPYSIDVFEDYLYIVTRRGLAFRWNKFGHGHPTKLVKSLAPQVGIKVFHKVRQDHAHRKSNFVHPFFTCLSFRVFVRLSVSLFFFFCFFCKGKPF